MKTALTIAGTDPSGGAGIQADIKTMTANGVFATCAVTALVAQNTTGVKSIVECTPDFLAEELDCVFTDIFPDAVKTGMVSSIPLIRVIAAKLKEYGAKNLVVDPVMVATSGDRLITEDAVSALKELLLPLATGACSAVGGNIMTDAFGIVAMVAMTPLITIQMMGYLGTRKERRLSAARSESTLSGIMYFDSDYEEEAAV